MGYPGDNSNGRGAAGDSAERTSRYQSARHDTGVTDSSPMAGVRRRKSGGGPVRPPERSPSRRNSALNGLPVTMPPPRSGDANEASGVEGAQPATPDEKGPIAMGRPGTQSSPPQSEPVQRRRSSGITRNLRRTGRAQRAVVADTIAPRAKPGTRTSGPRPSVSQRSTTVARTTGGTRASRPDNATAPAAPPKTPPASTAPPAEGSAATTSGLNLKPPRRLGSPRYSAVLKNRSSILGSRRTAAAAPPAAPERFGSGREPTSPIPAPVGRTSRSGRERPPPSHKVEWQILTSGGATIPCDSIEELRRWKHGKMAVVGVSFRCQAWRDWEDFRSVLRAGASGEDAFKSAGPI